MNLAITVTITVYTLVSILHQSPKLWLTIPEVIKNAKSLASTISQGKTKKI